MEIKKYNSSHNTLPASLHLPVYRIQYHCITLIKISRGIPTVYFGTPLPYQLLPVHGHCVWRHWGACTSRKMIYLELIVYYWWPYHDLYTWWTNNFAHLLIFFCTAWGIIYLLCTLSLYVLITSITLAALVCVLWLIYIYNLFYVNLLFFSVTVNIYLFIEMFILYWRKWRKPINQFPDTFVKGELCLQNHQKPSELNFLFIDPILVINGGELYKRYKY